MSFSLWLSNLNGWPVRSQVFSAWPDVFIHAAHHFVDGRVASGLSSIKQKAAPSSQCEGAAYYSNCVQKIDLNPMGSKLLEIQGGRVPFLYSFIHRFESLKIRNNIFQLYLLHPYNH
jgi:hypothetical protein